jgi:DNA modification methylase
MKLGYADKDIESAIIADKGKGVSDVEIGKRYGITYRKLEKIIRKATGVSVSVLKAHKNIRTLSPKDFNEETTTVWSFKSRGNWATHSGEYRGNWSPYIPRNVILKYSEPGEIVLDYFCGAGTTAVEAKLLGRRCVAFDINDKAIELAKQNVGFEIPAQESIFNKIYEPELFTGDARDLSFLKEDSIDLICAHPPYADIIHYTEQKESDLSHLEIEDFLREMKKVAEESYRVLKPGRQCAILIGDMRRHKHVVPLGFRLINIYLDAGFKLKELVIKRQHNCKTTGFWYTNSIKFNFLLLAHEYLSIFEKPSASMPLVKDEIIQYGLIEPYVKAFRLGKKLEELESATVWIFRENNLERLLNKNVIDRYSGEMGYKIVDIGPASGDSPVFTHKRKMKDLIFVKSSFLDKEEHTEQDVASYIEQLRDVLEKELPLVAKGGSCVVETKDVRIDGYVEPLAKHIVDSVCRPDLSLREIIVVTTESQKDKPIEGKMGLRISHGYLIVYKKNI